MNKARHELVVVGGGPAGYVAAIRAAQLGIDVACIDENDRFGGTCVRVGCIPSKALLESSHLYEQSRHDLEQHGVKVGDVTLDLDAMMARKRKIVDTLTGGINMLFKNQGVTPYQGRGRLRDVNSVQVTPTGDGEPTLIEADQILLCPGSVPAKLRSVEEDGDRIGNSTTALSFPSVPKRLVVIGGGYIGLELGSVWNRLGSEVIVLEAMDRILAGLDSELAQLAHRAFKKQGLDFRTKTFVESAKVDGDRCVVTIKDGDSIECDRVLLATGRAPATDDLGLESAGLETDNRGFLSVDENYETSVEGIYATGDCIGGAMLAHKAMEEAVVCVERMAGIKSHMNYDVIPAIVYTHPEIATVGKTEDQLKDEGVEYKKGVCPYGANGRARTLGEAEGRVKILADAATDRVLGAHIIGARAGDMIAEVAAAMEFGASSEDIARTCHAHPTMSEIVHEAALAVDDRAIHTI
ncbi:Dihydrolipoyl dehydrogenase [Crateriforma conspicua]|uniref:Dihydrolipoyl dehydrogenase n=1 Tax=Crateriforma conspicua TaxID=2527996 RepID=A0A5C6G202_9PLAN|nr:dihydrolipoyl dehydrogenase [Crateriforma conspicua]TWU67688.1 Dihydrolipoyl dehydrogenase [Crateriforma conspicua]